MGVQRVVDRVWGSRGWWVGSRGCLGSEGGCLEVGENGGLGW